MSTRSAIAWLSVAFCGVAASGAPPQPWPEDADLLVRIRGASFFELGGVGLIRMADGHPVVVAVGVADTNVAGKGAISHARREAEHEARVRLARFVAGEQMNSVIRSSQRLHMSSGTKGAEVDENWYEASSGVVDAVLRGTQVLSSLVDADKNRVHVVVILNESSIPGREQVTRADPWPMLPRVLSVTGSASATGDSTADLEAAIKNAVVRAVWKAGASVYASSGRSGNEPFHYAERVGANGEVDSIEILAERRDKGTQWVYLRVTVIAQPFAHRRTRQAVGKPARGPEEDI